MFLEGLVRGILAGMRVLIRVLIAWLPLAIAVTGLCFLSYIGIQQGMRLAYNDPSVRLAQDAVRRLGQGVEPRDLASGNEIDLRSSIEPFLLIYNEQKSVIAGSGVLHEVLPTPPLGVFDRMDFWKDIHTWQPERDTRIAAMILPYTGANGASGYVLAGRNMNFLEERIAHAGVLVFELWLFLMFATYIAKGIVRYLQ